MKLYKYLPVERVDVLENLRVRFTQLSSLNDPYEMHHSFNVTDLVNNLSKESRELLNEWWSDLSDDKRIELEPEYNQVLSEIEENSGNLIRENKMTSEMSKLMDKVIGVLSLSQTNESLLMWSHYADSGCGYVIEFDSNHEFFHRPGLNGVSTDPIVIKYEESPNLLDIGKVYDSSSILGVKSSEWAYEKEVRLTLNFIGIKPQVNSDNRPIIDPFGNKVYLADIPKDAIKSIFFGPRTSVDTKNRILKAINDNYIECQVFEHEVAVNTYKLIQRV
ncbi:DUF2971 domain-containing protein [Vibrio sp. CB1-14]|uniref:DUF2971 domain-containing protein n=1 Tax=Vibrio chaetopteri TaxID=3016528 RepID=A0AAU8BRF5_9VIBR